MRKKMLMNRSRNIYRIKLGRYVMMICLLLNFSQTRVFAENNVQSKKLTINKTNVSLGVLFKEIEEKTGFCFFYDNSEIDISQKTSVSVNNSDIEEVLSILFKNSNIKYETINRNIILRKGKNDEDKIEFITQQQQGLAGKVVDKEGNPLPGVTILVGGSSRGVITDVDGTYTIEVSPSDKLVFSYIGMEDQTVDVKNRKLIDVVMVERIDVLDELTVVAFAKQKKESVIASISTVKPKELKVPSSNLTTALAGRVSGLISYQRSGEPGEDDASFFVRGVTSFSYAAGPLILIDGVEMSSSDLSRMQPDDIESFSIMKDAAATALYGARGANGVIMITTKEGKEGKVQISVRHETSISRATTNIDLADPITYMRLNNEAVLARDPLKETPYSQEKIDKTIAGLNPYVYPANDWYNLLFKNSAINSRTNFNMSGGGNVARYYIAGTFNQDNGNLRVDKRNNFNNNIDLKNYLLRSNININVTNSTKAVVRLYGTFREYSGPLASGSSMYSRVMRSDPVAFPPFYEADETNKHSSHILFGNLDQGNYINPYADMIKGYKEYSQSKMQAQFELKQDLSMIIDGWDVRGLFTTDRYSFFDVKRSYSPYYYDVNDYDSQSDTYTLKALNADKGTEWLSYNPGARNISTSTYIEAATSYNNTFNKDHDVSGLFVFNMRNRSTPNVNSLAESLPERNMGIAGRMTYAFKSKYFTEFNFGYNGSERFSKNHRWGFFPSAGMGYILSNEDFWKGSLKKIISNLKLKATYGLSGSDAIGDASDRFFYLSEVNLNYSGRGHTWGENFGNSVNGVSTGRYANPNITWETSKKMNLGIELQLMDKIDFNVDFYTEHRTNILMNRSKIPTTMGLSSTPKTNVGEAKGKGIDFSLDFNHSFSKDFWITGRGNFTYAVSNYEVYEEVDYIDTPWLSRNGHATTQQWGYVAERLFIDEYDVANSPFQTFGEYGPGDIKYRDINGDGQISNLDRVPIGHPRRPEIIYGFGFSTGYKGLDFSCFFQGLANESFWIDPTTTAPFVDTSGNENIVSKNALLQVYADNHWSEDNRDNHALWPRLSDRVISNNTVNSTWFMRDGAFLRLKSLEVGYSLPKKIIKPIWLTSARLYFSGTNLFVISAFDLWDPEMTGYGLSYPIQKVFNFGFQFSF